MSWGRAAITFFGVASVAMFAVAAFLAALLHYPEITATAVVVFMIGACCAGGISAIKHGMGGFAIFFGGLALSIAFLAVAAITSSSPPPPEQSQ